METLVCGDLWHYRDILFNWALQNQALLTLTDTTGKWKHLSVVICNHDRGILFNWALQNQALLSLTDTTGKWKHLSAACLPYMPQSLCQHCLGCCLRLMETQVCGICSMSTVHAPVIWALSGALTLRCQINVPLRLLSFQYFSHPPELNKIPPRLLIFEVR